ncbi:MAG: hypothetical protein A3K19_27255 [Lentisphaerae bacterium RIFOXYB12_FULL_65_16]|nr:MAG: hypothetical protein A3K18_16020 [Lentisphaerae bacterium RIFOXYA12_64_32]OGV86388.1 MAG: hypothetical protein A3K19_27255 [Lentisphaerae bacterium RIFOXYB12_FULL_65_16]
MHALIYFDTEDFFSPPESPSHTLPAQLAEVMRRHGLQGCFHIHGERVRFWERHGMTDVIAALKWHDVSLHYDRGSVHPTTAEEVSELDWFRGVERTLFRELPGFQALERVFGRCSGLTQHGGTFAAQIVYAVGKLGKPFLYSPFRLPGRNVVWYCNNLLLGGYQADFYFDPHYRDTPKFDAALAKVNPYLDERAASHDFTAMFGCHPVITIMEKFPDAINFRHGATPPPKDWVAPTLVQGVSIPLILENFERLVKTLVKHPKVEWTTVAGIHNLYGQRPVRVSDHDVVAGAAAVVDNGGPTFTPLLSAAELLVLLARRIVAPAPTYEAPQVMGPTEEAAGATSAAIAAADTESMAREIVDAVMDSGYLPQQLRCSGGNVGLEAALLLLACHATGRDLPPEDRRRLTVEAIPGVSTALENVRHYKDWTIHGPRYHSEAIQKHFRLQCWTLKPAFTQTEYDSRTELGRDLNPMFERMP